MLKASEITKGYYFIQPMCDGIRRWAGGDDKTYTSDKVTALYFGVY